MKTTFEILQEEVSRHPLGKKSPPDGNTGMFIMAEIALKAMEAYHAQFSQQPTEKTREEYMQELIFKLHQGFTDQHDREFISIEVKKHFQHK